MLEYIGSLIVKGFTSGYYPCWKLSLDGFCYDELSESTLEHISKSVAEGYVEGEVVENDQNHINTGWWKLVFNKYY